MSDCITVLTIGDPHLKESRLDIATRFVSAVVDVAQSRKPDLIVVLGDLLDTMNVVRTFSHKLAIDMLLKLGKIAPTYLIIGNHDLVNNSQYLTDNHIFTPLKGDVEAVTHVHVCDRPRVLYHQDRMFVFCPYVPPGRFVEALSTLEEEGECWEMADCIFAHQEFAGAVPFGKGDSWNLEYPLVISGHIHEAMELQPNLHYTGSSIQHSFAESPRKGVWLNTFGNGWSREVVELDIVVKQTVVVPVAELASFDPDQYKGAELRVHVEGSREEIRSSATALQQLQLKGVKVVPVAKHEQAQSRGSFWQELELLVKDTPAAELLPGLCV